MKLYHTTTPEAAEAILANGFEDRVSAWSYIPDFENLEGGKMIPTGYYPPGVWVSDKPPIICIGIDQWAPDRTAWIEIEFDLDDPITGESWEQDCWPLNQWLCRADEINAKCRLRRMPLDEVLSVRRDQIGLIAEAYVEGRPHLTPAAQQEWDTVFDAA